ncbi:MAG: hypothetical protein E7517_07900 [Ruminococcaceae bacterium]|nr:hypothetical protein [Oscillospiraceae bacterium]
MAKKTNKTLPFGKAMIYGLGIFGIQFFIGYINSYQSQFYISQLGANLMVCAIIILIAKIISSFADPIIGNIIDRSHFKSGKMKPFVAMSALPLAIFTTLIFIKIDFHSTAVMYTYITVTTIIWNIAMSFADIPSQGMLPLLTPSSEERNSAAGISNFMKTIGLAAPGLVIPIICVLTKSENGAITEKEYLITALFIDVIGILCYVALFKGCKEVVKSQPTNMSFKAMFSEMKSNRNLMMVFLLLMLGFGRNMGMSVGVQAASVLFDKVTLPGGAELAGENLPILLGIGSTIGSVVSIILAPIINNKLGVKKTYFIFGIYGFVVSTVCYVLYIIGGPGAIFRSPLAAVLYQFFIGFMFGTHGFTPMVMLAETVDYREMTTGKRTEGTQYAVFSLGVKLSNAFSVAVAIFLVGLCGYTTQIPAGYSSVCNYLQQTGNTVVPNTILAAQWLIPGICTLLSCIPVYFYTINKKEQKEIEEFMTKKIESEKAQ